VRAPPSCSILAPLARSLCTLPPLSLSPLCLRCALSLRVRLVALVFGLLPRVHHSGILAIVVRGDHRQRQDLRRQEEVNEAAELTHRVYLCRVRERTRTALIPARETTLESERVLVGIYHCSER
jgi:hypothetical protein